MKPETVHRGVVGSTLLSPKMRKYVLHLSCGHDLVCDATVGPVITSPVAPCHECSRLNRVNLGISDDGS
jgi:hypothetical protein